MKEGGNSDMKEQNMSDDETSITKMIVNSVLAELPAAKSSNAQRIQLVLLSAMFAIQEVAPYLTVVDALESEGLDIDTFVDRLQGYLDGIGGVTDSAEMNNRLKTLFPDAVRGGCPFDLFLKIFGDVLMLASGMEEDAEPIASEATRTHRPRTAIRGRERRCA